MNQPDMDPADHKKNTSLLPDNGREVELAIVIGTRNRKEILVKCLQAIIGKIKVSHQIIVIDAGSTDGTIEYLKNIREIELICDGKPIGQAQSFNRVFPLLKSRYIGWISDDNVVQPGILDTAIKILQRNHRIGMVALKVKDVAGSYSGPPYNAGIYDTGILNCNQGVIRSDLFRKVGYFDESFKNRLCIVVTHRIATTKKADETFTLENGKIVWKNRFQFPITLIIRWRTLQLTEEAGSALGRDGRVM